jgi:GNAT superfamily N-acetyltransferase
MRLSFRVPDYQIWKPNYSKDEKLLKDLVEKSGTRKHHLWTMPHPETMILQIDNEPVGFVTASRGLAHNHRELFLCVDRKFQAKGIGNFLFEHIMQVLQNEHLVVDVYADQIGAISFLHKRGFVLNYVEYFCEIERDSFEKKILDALSKISNFSEIQLVFPRNLSMELESDTSKFIDKNIQDHLSKCTKFPYMRSLLETEFIRKTSDFDSAHDRIYLFEQDKVIGFLEYSLWDSDCYCVEFFAVDETEAGRVFFLQLKIMQGFLKRLHFEGCEHFSLSVRSFDSQKFHFFENLGELGVGLMTYTRP